ncbi:MAG: histidine triad nucleotide-binding protein [Deltaproteobacteria bacterium]|nr:histidine triad nucleotide-binding protein [Deltaproteobacteria bacterium]MBI2179402.1 histidine triad nucleotide-binding protein [Deltaproteobacteria bacterium]MBI2231381.1 histidine triad nucleotide-binding protein [Deltaproteobacteria bacterium]MBI2365029.1 histidine triad nucleotide-binding protein [Deltaproteobacteria bacterium]MBI2532931.1 histidine triad nucleotide-binding protein [Deltaproteobacteria bacterium]
MSDCLFCGVVEGKIKGNIVYQDDSVVAFKDINPKAPVHVLIIPRRHVAGVLDLKADDGAVIGHIFEVAARLAREQGIAGSGFRVVVNSGADAGQSVFHLHYHLLGGRRMTWPPG